MLVQCHGQSEEARRRRRSRLRFTWRRESTYSRPHKAEGLESLFVPAASETITP
jgi:hypothetical protein